MQTKGTDISTLPSSRRSPDEILYQVYIASFFDSNGDGIGDLKGITQKLDYIQDLHVDGFWITPFFPTPEGADGDNGYAVSDYRKIASQYGSVEDFKQLLAQAHQRGLKVYMDFVLPHTSHEHAWFQESRRGNEDYKDFYIWHNGKTNASGQLVDADGNAIASGDDTRPALPNNWPSRFGGPAWHWDEERHQYYLHHFRHSQPVLNLANPSVQDAVLNEMRFWLDMGVDGFRLDAVPHIGCDPEFRDNPLADPDHPRDNPEWKDYILKYSAFQEALARPMLEGINRLMHEYDPPRSTLGEVLSGRQAGENTIAIASHYTGGTLLNRCYTNTLLDMPAYPDKQTMRTMIADIEEHFGEYGGHCTITSCHDRVRSASRITNGVPPEMADRVLRQFLQLCLCMPGSFSLYQGEELGLRQARVPDDISPEQLQDTLRGEARTRDGGRTPMPWGSSKKNVGFSTHDRPYLPVPLHHRELAVDRQISLSSNRPIGQLELRDALGDSLADFIDRQHRWQKPLTLNHLHAVTKPQDAQIVSPFPHHGKPPKQSSGTIADSMLTFTRKQIHWRQAQPALRDGQTLVLDNEGDVLAFVRRNHKQTLLCLFNMGGQVQHFRPADYLTPALLEELHLSAEASIALMPYSYAMCNERPCYLAPRQQAIAL